MKQAAETQAPGPHDTNVIKSRHQSEEIQLQDDGEMCAIGLEDGAPIASIPGVFESSHGSARSADC